MRSDCLVKMETVVGRTFVSYEVLVLVDLTSGGAKFESLWRVTVPFNALPEFHAGGVAFQRAARKQQMIADRLAQLSPKALDEIVSRGSFNLGDFSR